jgi:tetratricopeptide (TPR) repeat protein
MLADLAGKLITLRQVENIQRLPTVIFGSTNTLAANLDQKTPTRIAMFPAISSSSPQLAMGLMTCLAYLLENYQEITVYRQFVRLEDTPTGSEHVWTIEQSQFTFDDWQLELLDDNTAIWGAFEETPDHIKLTLEVESDLLDESISAFKQEYSVTSLAELIAMLPHAAQKIAAYLNIDVNRVRLLETYPVAGLPDSAYLSQLVEQVFEFEARLLLHLWGQHHDLFAEWTTIHDSANEDPFSLWLLSAALSRLLLPGLGLRDQLPDDETLMSFFDSYPGALAATARSLAVNNWQAAVGLLEDSVDKNESVQAEQFELYFTLGDLYLQAGQLEQAAEHYQTTAALVPDQPTAQFRTAQVLAVLDDRNEATGGERIYTVAILEAYDRALALGFTNKARVLMSQLQLLLKADQEITPETIIRKFEQLVTEDNNGEFVTDAVEELYNAEDINFDFVLDILEKAVAEAPERIDRRINLANGYLVDDVLDNALGNAAEVLEAALAEATKPDQIAEIQRLMLYADDPDFESIMGEIIDKLGAKTPLDETEIDYLEQVVEAAPNYSEGYQLLVQGYQLWNDADAAMETLLDAVKVLPSDPEILVMLGQSLLDSEQFDLAISYLRRSAEQNPLHVPSLAYLGKALFDTDQYEEARTVMSRAELLAPRHPALIEVRSYIAGRMAE